MAGRPQGPTQHVPVVLTLNAIGNLKYTAADIFCLLPQHDSPITYIEFAARHGLLRNTNFCLTCAVQMNRVGDIQCK